jgi:hypothetical protein
VGDEDEGGFWAPFADLFRATVEQGEEWGPVWVYLLPAALALFFVMVLFSGLRFTAQKIEEHFKAWWVFAICIGIVLLIAAFTRERASADDDGSGRAVTVEATVSTA